MNWIHSVVVRPWCEERTRLSGHRMSTENELINYFGDDSTLMWKAHKAEWSPNIYENRLMRNSENWENESMQTWIMKIHYKLAEPANWPALRLTLELNCVPPRSNRREGTRVNTRRLGRVPRAIMNRRGFGARIVSIPRHRPAQQAAGPRSRCVVTIA